MKLYKLFLGLFIVLTFINCDEKSSEKQKTTSVKKKQLEKVIQRPWDSLNKKNVHAFFTEYGKQNKETKVIIKTDFGNIKLKLYNDTPIHRANFIFLTKIGYFTNTVFYRVAKNFVIQGGDSEDFQKSKVRYKYKNYFIAPEFRKNRKHKYGALASAREWENNPNKLSTPFEFYIIQNRNGAHHLNNEHTVFGEVISGFKTIDKIANVKIGPGEWPINDVIMKVEIIE